MKVFIRLAGVNLGLNISLKIWTQYSFTVYYYNILYIMCIMMLKSCAGFKLLLTVCAGFYDSKSTIE